MAYMSDGKDVICTGCGRTAFETGMYDSKDNPVEEDGTYADKKFVCDTCYAKLVFVGQDIGTPIILQKRAELQGQIESLMKNITTSGYTPQKEEELKRHTQELKDTMNDY